MKKAIVTIGLLAVVAAANAELRLFYTASTKAGLVPGSSTAAPGLLNSASVWNKVSFAITSNDDIPTYTDNKDFSGTVATQRFRMGTFPTYSAVVPTITPAGVDGIAGTSDDEFVYMWAQFYQDTAPKIRSWMPGVKGPVDAAHPTGYEDVNPTWYKQDNMGGSGTTAAKRWDGSSTEANNYADFRANPQTLAAIQTAGIPNSGLDDTGSAWNNGLAWNLYNSDVMGSSVYPADPQYVDDGIHTRITLVGSFQPLNAGLYNTTQSADVDGSGVVISNIIATGFNVVPEPASMLLIGLAGLMIRRR